MIIAIDFDGTCVLNEFPCVGSSIGAEKVLKELTDKGHKLILWTMRANVERYKMPETGLVYTGQYLDDAIHWFKARRIPLWGIQYNPLRGPAQKIHCDLFIDDKGLGIPLTDAIDGMTPFVDWEKVREILIDKKIL